MKKKAYYYLALLGIFCFENSIFSNNTSDKPNVTLQKVSNDFILDGIIDACVQNSIQNDISINVDGQEATLNAYWKGVWNDNGIYIAVNVEDDVFYTAYSVDPAASDTWNYDKPEIYIDVNETLEDGLGPAAGDESGHFQIAPTFIKDGDGQENILDNSCKFAHKVTGSNYIFEYFIPFTYLNRNSNLTHRCQIGFDATIVDRDNAENERVRKTWSNDNSNGESWNNMDGCGTISLISDCQTVINSSKDNMNIQISPIPANSFITIKSSEEILQYILYNMEGKLLVKELANGSHFNIDLNNFESGMYYIKFKTKNGFYTNKLIIAK